MTPTSGVACSRPGRAGSRTVVRVDLDPAQMHKNVRGRPPRRRGRLDRARETCSRRWLERRPGWPSRAPGPGRLARPSRPTAARDAGPWAPIQRSLASALPADTVVAGDSSQVTYYGTVHHWPFTPANRLLYPTGYATLGYGLPAAIGAKVAAAGTTGDRRCSVTARRCSASRSWSPPRSSGWRCRSSSSTTAATARSASRWSSVASSRRPSTCTGRTSPALARAIGAHGVVAEHRGRARAARGAGTHGGPADRHPPRRRLTTAAGHRARDPDPGHRGRAVRCAGGRCRWSRTPTSCGPSPRTRRGSARPAPRRRWCVRGPPRTCRRSCGRPPWPGPGGATGGADRAVRRRERGRRLPAAQPRADGPDPVHRRRRAGGRGAARAWSTPTCPGRWPTQGLFYPPDPASWETSTIGGNVATNAGGLCCVKYGVTGRLRARARGGARRRVGAAHRPAHRQGRRGLRPDPAVRRLRGHAGRRHRGHAGAAARRPARR